MKKIIFTLLIILTALSCTDSEETIESKNITLNFSHTWDGVPITNADFNTFKFTTKNGEQLKIERLRYVISDVTLETSNGEFIVINAHNLVDVTNNKNLTFAPTAPILTGSYSNMSFIFGFKNEKNISAAYEDLNTAIFGVPEMLGGGYHYMQLDGKFKNESDETIGYNFHAIRAVDASGDTPTFPKDTFIKVNLGPVSISDNTTFNIEMNIAEWFKNPHTWNLNQLHQTLMPNTNAQIMMFDNGQSVFNLKSIN